VSVYFEAVVVAADESTMVRSLQSLSEQADNLFGPITLELHSVAERGFVIFCSRVGAKRPQAAEEVENLANELSLKFGIAVAVHYDDQVGVRTAMLSQDGEPMRHFGEAEEVWIPYGDNGELVTDGLRYPGDAIPDDIECDCIRNGIDAAFEAAEFHTWVSSAWLAHVACRKEPVWQRPGQQNRRTKRST
jgi:hypothetical protein